ncbi:MAG: endolytic transglycosylase MltG [Legionella sp.]
MPHLRHKKLIISFLIIFLMSFLLLAGFVYQQINTPMRVVTDNRVIKLDRAASAHQFVNALKNKQLIDSSRLLLSIIRFKGLSHKLKAGIYEIKQGETALELLDRVVAGDVLVEYFTIIEGTTQQRVNKELMNAPYLEYHEGDWNSIKGSHANSEGLLLADTYQYNGGSSSKFVLELANKSLINYLNKAWDGRDNNLPYQTPYELLIAASIIEKETSLKDEKKIISGVIVNRLNVRMPLQMDPTVIYGLGDRYKGKLAHNDMQDNSPYNTYRNRGLPPTPIAMVGKEAIDAAAHPQQSKYLYFVAKGDGSHHFSENYTQQRQAIERYRRKDI